MTGPSRPSARVTDTCVLLLGGLDVLRQVVTSPDGLLAWRLAVSVTAVAALLLRRRCPVVTLIVVLPGLALAGTWFATAIALYQVALRRPATVAAGCAAVTVVVSAAAVLAAGHGRAGAGAVPVVLADLTAIAAAPVALGLLVAALRAQEHRRTEERTSLAQELHDSVGHAASLIALRAAALGAGTQDPAVAREAAAIRSLSSQALDEMRRLTGALRVSAAPVSAPGLSELPGLIARAGHVTHSRVAVGRPDRWPAATQAAAFRVVQEALTNAARHAPGAWVHVDVGSVDDDTCLVVEVRNGPPTRPPAPERGGSGLTGLRDRVAALGGTLRAAPTPDGGYLLRAAFP
ncbi:sensor histidine kinase, partial [Streptomyces sp. URMC 129]|uniref:sensor histidine kinase n=1 Tax=Streptomyces sp. URMC 129 TaxID=3423407 RepID=UPI003F1B6CE4